MVQLVQVADCCIIAILVGTDRDLSKKCRFFLRTTIPFERQNYLTSSPDGSGILFCCEERVAKKI